MGNATAVPDMYALSDPDGPDRYDPDFKPPDWAAQVYNEIATRNADRPDVVATHQEMIREVLEAKAWIAAKVDASDVCLPEPTTYVEIELRLDGEALEVRTIYTVRADIRDVIPADVADCQEAWEDWGHHGVDQTEWVEQPYLDEYLRRVMTLLDDPVVKQQIQDRAEQAFREQIQEIRRAHISLRAGRGQHPGPRPEDTCCKVPDWLARMRDRQAVSA